MCFTISQSYPNEMIASNRIPCYKVLYRRYYGTIVAPVYSATVYFGRFFPLWRKKIQSAIEFGLSTNKIEAGLHSFSTYPMAHSAAASFAGLWGGQYETYRAYIPKGARYWYNPHRGEYVSDKLVVSRRRVKHNVRPVKK